MDRVEHDSLDIDEVSERLDFVLHDERNVLDKKASIKRNLSKYHKTTVPDEKTLKSEKFWAENAKTAYDTASSIKGGNALGVVSAGVGLINNNLVSENEFVRRDTALLLQLKSKGFSDDDLKLVYEAMNEQAESRGEFRSNFNQFNDGLQGVSQACDFIESPDEWAMGAAIDQAIDELPDSRDDPDAVYSLDPSLIDGSGAGGSVGGEGASDIRVEAGKLRSSADKIDSSNKTMKGTLDEALDIVNNLMCWEGDAKGAFIDAFDDLRTKLQGGIDLINQYVQFLNDSATKYEQAEAERAQDNLSFSDDISSSSMASTSGGSSGGGGGGGGGAR